MSHSSSRSRLLIWLIVLAALSLLACETTNLIAQTGQRQPTGRSSRPPAEDATRDPAAPFEFMPFDQPHCSAGDNSASVIVGSVTIDGAPAVGQQVQASASPGGEPFGDAPVQADENGYFQVTLICDGAACNGSYFIWLVNDTSEQISPLIEYYFDDQCRRGTVNFGNR